MAAKTEQRDEQKLNGRSIAYAVTASLAVGGPLLGMMGFVLLATLSLLLVTSPLLLLFSPVLVPVALFLSGAMASSGAAVVMGFLGAASVMWAGRATRDGLKRRLFGGDRDFGGYLKEKGE